MAKKIKKRSINPTSRKVLIVKPHNVEFKVDERVDVFIEKAMLRGIGQKSSTMEKTSVGSKLPELARNNAIKSFLYDPRFAHYTHIFFLDADTEPVNEYAIEKLLSHNKDVVVGVTPIVRDDGSGNGKHFRCLWSAIIKNEAGEYENIGIDELPKKLFKADRVGGTTMLLSRKVIETLKPPYQKTEFNEDWTGVKLSEDYYFSDKLIEAGFDIWVDPTVICHHYHYSDLLDLFYLYLAMKNAK